MQLAEHKWPELLNFIQQLCCQGKAEEKELGLYTLSVVVEVAAEEFKPFLKSFMPIFHNALQDPSTGSAYYAGITLRNLTYCIGSEEAVIILLFCCCFFNLMADQFTLFF